jgi:hypothetical protein
MGLLLPEPVTVYFEFSNGSSAVCSESCFTADAVVIDEKQTYQGHNAIQTWMDKARNTFQFSVEPVSVSQSADQISVKAKLVGNFPGSPVHLDHVFELSGGKIRYLEIS